MDLNYKHQLKQIVQKIKQQVQRLRWSYASTAQKQRIISFVRVM
jgi:hypothetical protein